MGEKALADAHQSIKITAMPDYVPHDALRHMVRPNAAITADALEQGHHHPATLEGPEDIVQAAGVGLKARLLDETRFLADCYLALRDAAADVLLRGGVSVLLFDIEYTLWAAALIGAARHVGIPVVSLQHESGYYRIYANFQVVADYYVAYSAYNRFVISDLMHVAAERIWSTGLPALTAPKCTRSVSKADKDWFQSRHQIAGDKRAYLIALKPFSRDSYHTVRQHLEVLMAALKAHAAELGSCVFILRRHPRLSDSMDFCETLLDGAGINYVIDDAREPLAQSLPHVDGLITYPSNAVVDAVEAAVPVALLDYEDHSQWPDWKDGHVVSVYDAATPDTLLRQIVTGEWPKALSLEAFSAVQQRFGRFPGPDAAALLAQKLHDLLEQNVNVPDEMSDGDEGERL